MTTSSDATPATSRRRRALEIATENNLLVVACLVVATFLVVVGRQLLLADSWLTLVAGREIIANGLPREETLTVFAAGREWIDQQWLAQLGFYGAFRLGGLGLAIVLNAALVTGAIAITVVGARARGASARTTLLATIVFLVVAPTSWALRAQSAALPLFAAVLALLATDSGLTRRRTLAVFPLLVLWANLHGSVILGALLVSLAAAIAVLERALGRGTRIPGWRAALYFAAPWACVLASPYSTDLVSYYRTLLVSSPVSKVVTEWRAPEPHGYTLVFFAVAAVTVVIAAWRWRRLSLFDLAVLLLTLAGALRSVRGIVWFALAGAMLLPLALDGARGRTTDTRINRRLAHVLIAIGAVGAAVAVAVVLTRPTEWFERHWPREAARITAQKAAASGRTEAVWPTDRFADWLLWKEPSLRGRIAWDVRFELLTPSQLRSLVRFNAHVAGWERPAAGYAVLVLDRSKNDRQIRDLTRSGDATVVYRGREIVVLERRSTNE